jgi:uncharacterized membrane protein YeaQ/YmgE (transglycosylase-associated protein family)
MNGRPRAPKVKAADRCPAREAEADTGPPPTAKMAPSDLLALIINGLFGLLGLLIMPSNPSVGIVTTAFFGSGAVFLGWLHWRRYQDHRLQFTDIEVVGGARILPRRGFLLTIGFWLTSLGTLMVVFGQSYPILFQWLGGLIALSGAVLLVLVALRIVPAGFLQFEPQGLIIGSRSWQAIVPWDWIIDVQQTEFQNNSMVLLTIANVEQLDVKPATARPKALRAIGQKPFTILPLYYGIPSPLLAAAIKRYANDAEARESLRVRQLMH